MMARISARSALWGLFLALSATFAQAAGWSGWPMTAQTGTWYYFAETHGYVTQIWHAATERYNSGGQNREGTLANDETYEWHTTNTIVTNYTSPEGWTRVFTNAVLVLTNTTVNISLATIPAQDVVEQVVDGITLRQFMADWNDALFYLIDINMFANFDEESDKCADDDYVAWEVRGPGTTFNDYFWRTNASDAHPHAFPSHSTEGTAQRFGIGYPLNLLTNSWGFVYGKGYQGHRVRRYWLNTPTNWTPSPTNLVAQVHLVPHIVAVNFDAGLNGDYRFRRATDDWRFGAAQLAYSWASNRYEIATGSVMMAISRARYGWPWYRPDGTLYTNSAGARAATTQAVDVADWIAAQPHNKAQDNSWWADWYSLTGASLEVCLRTNILPVIRYVSADTDPAPSGTATVYGARSDGLYYDAGAAEFAGTKVVADSEAVALTGTNWHTLSHQWLSVTNITYSVAGYEADVVEVAYTNRLTEWRKSIDLSSVGWPAAWDELQVYLDALRWQGFTAVAVDHASDGRWYWAGYGWTEAAANITTVSTGTAQSPEAYYETAPMPTLTTDSTPATAGGLANGATYSDPYEFHIVAPITPFRTGWWYEVECRAIGEVRMHADPVVPSAGVSYFVEVGDYGKPGANDNRQSESGISIGAGATVTRAYDLTGYEVFRMATGVKEFPFSAQVTGMDGAGATWDMIVTTFTRDGEESYVYAFRESSAISMKNNPIQDQDWYYHRRTNAVWNTWSCTRDLYIRSRTPPDPIQGVPAVWDPEVAPLETDLVNTQKLTQFHATVGTGLGEFGWPYLGLALAPTIPYGSGTDYWHGWGTDQATECGLWLMRFDVSGGFKFYTTP